MGRASRTYRLDLSSAGMDLLIAAHCRLIRVTRYLLAWGTTLHVAVHHLDTLPPDVVRLSLDTLPDLELGGSETHCLGAPIRLREIASRIATRVSESDANQGMPPVGQIYIVALQHVLTADPDALRASFRGISSQAPGREAVN